MKPNELYQCKPDKEDKDVYKVRDFFPEVYNIYDFDEDHYVNLTRFSIKYYADPYIDGYRVWRLASIWIDNKPFMVIQLAGRGGRDHTGKFITDSELYVKCVQYLQSFCPIVNDFDVFNPEEDISTLTKFCGSSWSPKEVL